MYIIIFKRILDFVIAFCGLIILLPIFVLIMFTLLIVNSGMIFFTQNRPGKNGKIFKVIKFRTMNNKCGINGYLLPDSKRLTKIGKFIRSTSMDELPQLINILKGDMSLIGPRPLLPQYLPLYNNRQKRRHLVRPGITGWAQVNRRNAITRDQKFEFDVWYLDNCSFILVFKLFCLTIKKVLIREGLSSETSVTMEPFTGNN